MAKEKPNMHRQQLDALIAVPGALKIITAQPISDDPALDRYSPASFVQHDAVRIEDVPSRPDQVRVFSDEGDFVQGQPDAVLRRLQEWQHAPAAE